MPMISGAHVGTGSTNFALAIPQCEKPPYVISATVSPTFKPAGLKVQIKHERKVMK